MKNLTCNFATSRSHAHFRIRLREIAGSIESRVPSRAWLLCNVLAGPLLAGLELKGAPPPLKTGARNIWRQCSAVRKWARLLCECSHKRVLLTSLRVSDRVTSACPSRLGAQHLPARLHRMRYECVGCRALLIAAHSALPPPSATYLKELSVPASELRDCVIACRAEILEPEVQKHLDQFPPQGSCMVPL